MRGSSSTAGIFLITLLAACRDYDQRARALGREAHHEAERACPQTDAGAPESAFGSDACLTHACEAPCTKAGAPSFQRVCLDICAARGGCDRDEDCDPGLRCVAIAPVLRRCASAPMDAGR